VFGALDTISGKFKFLVIRSVGRYSILDQWRLKVDHDVEYTTINSRYGLHVDYRNLVHYDYDYIV
jgi:hypothetical protein